MMTAVPRATAGKSSTADTAEVKVLRILAIDYGRKRIGLALSDELGLTAQPLATRIRSNRQNDMRYLRETCRKHAVGRVIVGHPVHMTGEAGEMAEEAERFAARVRKDLGVEVELVDERLTSWEAAQMVAEQGRGKRSKREAIDDVAAAVLLRDYLSRPDQRVIGAGATPGEATRR